MNFDCVIMNPPYAKKDKGSGTSASPIYHLFVKKAIDEIKPSFLMAITPSRWMVRGKGLKAFRHKMMKDRRIRFIVDNMAISGWFPTVEIPGGVSYFLWDTGYSGKCSFNGVQRFLDEEDIIIREDQAIDILKKVRQHTTNWIGKNVSPVNPYGIPGDGTFQDSGLPCHFNKTVGLVFVAPESVKDPQHDVHLWRVLAPRSASYKADFSLPNKIFSTDSLIVAKPGEYCSSTYVVLNNFVSKLLAENFTSYVKTCFFRFMLRMRMVSQDINKNCYNWVPDLEDYSQEITDKMLFNKFKLSNDEQQFITSKIIPFEES